MTRRKSFVLEPDVDCELSFIAAFSFFVAFAGTYTVLAFAGVVPW